MKLIFTLIILFFGLQSHADQLSLFGGLNTTEFDGPNGWDREFGWEIGATFVHPLQNNLSLRTGGGVVQKSSEVDVINQKFEFLFLEVPATLMYTFNSKFSVFGGFNLDITLADDGAKSESFALNAPIGMRYSWSRPHSLEAILEFGITDIAEVDTKIGNSFSIRYLYDFNVSFR